MEDRDELEELKEALEASIKKNGDKPLTLKHLANIIGLIQKNRDREDGFEEIYPIDEW